LYDWAVDDEKVDCIFRHE